MSEINLKPCPFCGGTKLKIEYKSKSIGSNGLDARVERHTYSVRCNICHARGGAVGGNVIHPISMRLELPSWATTDKEIKSKAIKCWNRRATDENT